MSYNYFNGLFDMGKQNDNGLSCIYQNLSELKSIQGGTYKRLLSAYYKETNDDEIKKEVGKIDGTVASKEMTEVKKYTDQLSKSAKSLLEQGNKSLYREGKEKECLDTVRQFVKSYNGLVESANDTTEGNISGKVSSMVSNTRSYADDLEKIGISVTDSGALKIDETKFKDADMQEVKNLFGGYSSFGFTTWKFGTQIGAAAQNAVNGIGTYSVNGNHSYLNMTSYYDTYL